MDGPKAWRLDAGLIAPYHKTSMLQNVTHVKEDELGLGHVAHMRETLIKKKL